jgi:hypothetical protein
MLVAKLGQSHAVLRRQVRSEQQGQQRRELREASLRALHTKALRKRHVKELFSKPATFHATKLA